LDILFANRKLQEEFNDFTALVRKRGNRRARLIQRRLGELSAANVLEVMRRLPAPRCHELGGNRKGQLSVDLDHPYRLIFRVADNPVPTKADGGLDWTQVRKIIVLGVEDTHG
jgi:proteic killer suppression protein